MTLFILLNEAIAMSESLRKFLGVLLLFSAVGIASCQALLASCAPNALVMPSILKH